MVGLTLKAVSVLAGVFGVLSFMCLVVAISTDHWYIIDTSGLLVNNSSLRAPSSHSGLWRVCYFCVSEEGCGQLRNPPTSDTDPVENNVERPCDSLVNPFGSTKNYTHSVRRIIHMQGAFSVLLPLSVIIMVAGGMLGFMALLARSYLLLMMTGVLLLLGALITAAGASIYIVYSALALWELMCMLDPRALEGLGIHFGWSLALAWTSGASELIASIAFFLACRLITQQREQQAL